MINIQVCCERKVSALPLVPKVFWLITNVLGIFGTLKLDASRIVISFTRTVHYLKEVHLQIILKLGLYLINPGRMFRNAGAFQWNEILLAFKV